MKIAGLDIGTTGCKCTVFNRSGEYLGKSYRDYPVSRDVSGHEVDASVIMDAVYQVLSEVAEKYSDIVGIGVTSFGETFVPTDEAGIPLYPAMLYTDPRGTEECRELIERLGEKTIAKITGLRPHEMYSISKLMWLKKNRQDIYEKTAYIFLMEDYVVYRLTGVRQIDYSLASRTMAFDIQKMEWSIEICNAADIDVQRLSKTVPAGTDAGVIRKDVSEKTGLAENTHIISISHDQIAAAVGAGVFDSAEAVDGAGTVECITPIYDSVPDTDVMYNGHFAVVPYVIPGKYAAYAFSYTGGALIQWCTDTLAKKEKEWAKAEEESVNRYLEKQSKSPTGLLVLPHFAGAATPYMDTGAKGAILGLTTASTTADIYRGCMEGVVYEMLCNIKALEGSGCRFSRLRATGGGARSGEWMQMKADILNMPVTALETEDAGTVGSAMLTGMSLGIFGSLEDAAEHMVEKKKTYNPRVEMHEKYMKIYQRYEMLYQTVRPLMEKGTE